MLRRVGGQNDGNGSGGYELPMDDFEEGLDYQRQTDSQRGLLDAIMDDDVENLVDQPESRQAKNDYGNDRLNHFAQESSMLQGSPHNSQAPHSLDRDSYLAGNVLK